METGRVYILSCQLYPEVSHAQFKTYLMQLPPDLRRRILQLTRWQDAQASLFGKMLLKAGLIRYFRLSGQVLSKLRYTKYGKPYLPHSEVNFNISHAGRHIVCILSATALVGIDVEQIRPVAIYDFSDQFSKDELADILEPGNEYSRFFQYWVKKEAVAKATGAGLQMPMRGINLARHKGKVKADFRNWYVYELELDDDHCSWFACDRLLSESQIIKESFVFH